MPVLSLQGLELRHQSCSIWLHLVCICHVPSTALLLDWGDLNVDKWELMKNVLQQLTGTLLMLSFLLPMKYLLAEFLVALPKVHHMQLQLFHLFLQPLLSHHILLWLLSSSSLHLWPNPGPIIIQARWFPFLINNYVWLNVFLVSPALLLPIFLFLNKGIFTSSLILRSILSILFEVFSLFPP